MKKLIPILFLSITFLLSACSGDTNKQEADTDQSSDTRTVEIYGIDQMKYVVKEQSEGLQTGDTYEVNGETYYLLEGINATAGEELVVKLTTISKIPPTAMSHNWLLLNQGADAQAFNAASIQAKDNNYVAPDMGDMVLQNTGMAGGGETVEVSFSAPDQTGDYEYLCTFPGHFSADMRGTLSVQ